jgi:hypothetical protein
MAVPLMGFAEDVMPIATCAITGDIANKPPVVKASVNAVLRKLKNSIC